MNASFFHTKQNKQVPLQKKSTQVYKLENQTPKTFQQIAIRNYGKITTNNYDEKSKIVIDHNITNKFIENKKNNGKQQLIRKSNSQVFKLPFMKNLQKKTYVNSKQKKQNLDFKSIIQKKDTTPPIIQHRPQIMPPSFLKNTRSFIQTISENNYKDNSFCQGVQKLYQGSDCQSITLSDRNSLQDFDISMNISLREASDKDNGSVGSSNLTNSIELAKELQDINSKIKIILNSSLNFGRKASEEQTNNKPGTSRQSQGTNNFSAKLITPPGLKVCYDTTSQKSMTQNPTLSSINFSKKFQHYKKHATKHSPPTQKKFKLNDFDLIDEIGSGKYGKVYMARHKDTGFLCAIKSVSKIMIQQENIQVPFIRQIKIQMYLNHPNIVKLYGFFSDEQNVYLIMQYCSGGHLLKEMKVKNNFQEPQILDILSNIFQAVSFIHCHGIIHRDIKPQNIVIENGIYKLCDFGWAAYARGDARTTFCGTPLYVSPQILKGQQYDAKTDVWGLGIITYQLAYGRVPFPIWSQADMKKIVNDPVYFPTWANVSEKMQSLIKTMLFKNPQDRCSLNQILNHGIIKQYLGFQKGIKSQIQSLF